jgi:hypothetical protein
MMMNGENAIGTPTIETQGVGLLLARLAHSFRRSQSEVILRGLTPSAQKRLVNLVRLHEAEKKKTA